MKPLAPLALVALLAACTGNAALDAQHNTAAVVQACNVAAPLAAAAAVIPVYGTGVAAGVTVGCTTAAGLQRLASDPSSVEWLNKQSAMLQTALGKHS